MGFSPIQHPVIRLFTNEALEAAGGADTATSEWVDTSGWADKTIAVEQDNAEASPDLNITLHISEQGYYELNNKTCTTEDYEAVTIVDALSATTYTQYDSDDIDELQRAFRSARVVIENDDDAACAVTLWFGSNG